MRLQSKRIFTGIDAEIIEILESNARISTYSKGDVVHFDEGMCTHLEVVLSGGVVISHITSDGTLHNIRLLNQESFITPNNLFATDPTYFVYVEAIENTSVLSIPKNVIERVLSNNSFRVFFLRLISDTGKLMGSKLLFERKMSLRMKILTYLRRESHVQQTTTIILPVSKTMLANNLGVARTSLSRELQKMKKDGLIDFSNKSIHLLSKKP